jgi:hypothetical protein
MVDWRTAFSDQLSAKSKTYESLALVQLHRFSVAQKESRL